MWNGEVKERDVTKEKSVRDAMLLALKVKKRGARRQGMWGPPETGQGKEMDSPLELPERNVVLLSP